MINKEAAQMPPEEPEREILILKELDHLYIVRLIEWCGDYNNVYVVMEAAEGGELREVVEKAFYDENRPLTETWTAQVFKQVLEAIAYCHAQRVMHKDIKDENFMLLNKPDLHTVPHAVVISA